MREKKKRQKLRAALAGDEFALASLAERSPPLAVEPCLNALANDAPSASQIARALAERLRRSGKHAEVARLVSANGSRDLGLALEGALSAFAAGNDGEAARLSNLHPEVGELVRPLLGAVREPPTQPARGRKPASAAGRGLANAAVATLATRMGQRDRAQRAFRDLAGLGELIRNRLRLDAVRAACFLSASMSRADPDRRLSRWVVDLVRDTPEPARSEVVSALAGEALGAHPATLRVITNALERELDRHDLTAARASVARARLASLDGALDKSRIASFLADVGVDAYDGESRGAARLYAAFGHMTRDRRAALRELDIAVAEGGDFTEALRGRFLALLGLHAGGEEVESELSAAAERLLHALSRGEGAELDAAFALALILCEAFAREAHSSRQAKLARGWLERARELAGRVPAMSRQTAEALDLIESQAYVESDPGRALRAAERILEESPLSVAAWHARIAAGRVGRDPRVEDWEIEAWRATGSDEFASIARATLQKRGELAPLEGTTFTRAGPLAEECLRLLGAGPVSSERVSEIREQAAPALAGLEPKERVAFDCALFCAAGPDAKVLAHFMTRVFWEYEPIWLGRFLSIAVNTESDVALAQTARLVVSAQPTRTGLGPRLRELVAALSAIDAKAGRKLVFELAPSLSQSALGEAQRGLVLGHGAEAYDAMFDEIHDRLHPEVCLDDVIENGAVPSLPRETLIGPLAEALFLPSADVARLPREILNELSRELLRAFTANDGLEELHRMAARHGIFPDQRERDRRSGTPSMRALSKSERNRRKRERKGR